MRTSGSSIFRNEALEYYIQSRENTILPRISKPPAFLCMWILLALCVIATAGAWLNQVPVYASGSGVILEQEAALLVFIPTDTTHPLNLRAGAPVYVLIGVPAQIINSTIDQVEAGVLSPGDVQQRYGLGDKVSQLVTGPSIVASVKLSATFPVRDYRGSVVSVQVQIGTTRVLSLLTGSLS